MLGSGRGKRIAAVLALTLGLAFVACALVYGLSQQSYYLQTADNAAAEYARHTAYEEKKACRGVATVQLSQCRADAKAEYTQKQADNRREYDDLVAQQTSALWTKIMGVTAIIGLALSALGVFLIWGTWIETRRIGEAQARAYLAIERAGLCVWENGTVEIALDVRNLGASPAHDFLWRSEVYLGYRGHADLKDFDPVIVSNVPGSDIPTSAPVEVGQIAHPIVLDPENLQKFLGPEGVLVTVKLWYCWRDVFDVQHSSKFMLPLAVHNGILRKWYHLAGVRHE